MQKEKVKRFGRESEVDEQLAGIGLVESSSPEKSEKSRYFQGNTNLFILNHSGTRTQSNNAKCRQGRAICKAKDTDDVEQHFKIHKNAGDKYYAKFCALINFPFILGLGNVFNLDVPENFWGHPLQNRWSKNLLSHEFLRHRILITISSK